MKIYTIGRGENSHIFIDHPLVSRQHALLKVYGSGKMVIVDKSSNGTSINGSQIKRDRETPVTRRDVVTFAGVSQLDWKEVPDPLKVFKIIGLVLAAIAVVIGILLAIRAIFPGKEPVLEETPQEYFKNPTESGNQGNDNQINGNVNPKSTKYLDPKDMNVDELLKNLPPDPSDKKKRGDHGGSTGSKDSSESRDKAGTETTTSAATTTTTTTTTTIIEQTVDTDL